MSPEQIKRTKYLLKWKVPVKRIAWELKCSIAEIEKLKKNKVEKPKLKPKVQHKDYYHYINSPEWRHKRIKKLQSTNYKCEDCGRKASQVHHKHYKTLYKESMTDLESLCGDCHMDKHNIPSEIDKEYKTIVI